MKHPHNLEIQNISRFSWHKDVKFAIKLQCHIQSRSEGKSFSLVTNSKAAFFHNCNTQISIIPLYNIPNESSNNSFLSLAQFLQGYFQAPVLFSIGKWIRCQWDRFSTFRIDLVHIGIVIFASSWLSRLTYLSSQIQLN